MNLVCINKKHVNRIDRCRRCSQCENLNEQSTYKSNGLEADTVKAVCTLNNEIIYTIGMKDKESKATNIEPDVLI